MTQIETKVWYYDGFIPALMSIFWIKNFKSVLKVCFRIWKACLLLFFCKNFDFYFAIKHKKGEYKTFLMYPNIIPRNKGSTVNRKIKLIWPQTRLS